MSMILNKYKIKRKIGRGAYGDVVLVSDLNGKQIAIKMVSKKSIQKDPYLQPYLQGQKEVMMSIKDRHIVQLYDFEQDENYNYFVCEYCNGGDLLNYQAKQPNKVFTLKQATEILSQVIKGLQRLHCNGYLLGIKIVRSFRFVFTILGISRKIKLSNEFISYLIFTHNFVHFSSKNHLLFLSN